MNSSDDALNLSNLCSFSRFCEEVQEYEAKNPTSEKFPQFLEKLSLPLGEIPTMKEIKQLHCVNFAQQLSKKEKKPLKKWNKNEKIVLAWAVCYYNVLNNKKLEEMIKSDWTTIGSLIGKEPIDSIFKFYSMIVSNIQSVEWSNEENELLSKIVKKKQKKCKKIKWIEVARELYTQTSSCVFRNEKMCREHWISHLDPNLVKSPWNLQEDLTLLSEFLIHSTKWSRIAEKLNGRNSYSVKNHFYSLCTKNGIDKDSRFLKSSIQKLLAEFQKNLPKKPNFNEKNLNELPFHNNNNFNSNNAATTPIFNIFYFANYQPAPNPNTFQVFPNLCQYPYMTNFANNCFTGNFMNKNQIEETFKQNLQEQIQIQIQPNANSFNMSTNSFVSSKGLGLLENKSTTTETEIIQDFKYIEKKTVGKPNINSQNIQRNVEMEDPVEKYFNF